MDDRIRIRTCEISLIQNFEIMELKVILENAELPDIRFYDLRHTFVTHALSGGVDAKTLPEILEHTNPSFILDTYTHVTTQMHKDATAIVGNFLEQIMWGNTMTKRRRKKGMGAARL